jgi:hypothetical protein
MFGDEACDGGRVQLTARNTEPGSEASADSKISSGMEMAVFMPGV